MDSLRTQPRNTVKTPRPSKRPQPEPIIPKPTINEGETFVNELKKLYLDTIKLDVDLQLEIYNLEKKFEPKHNEIYDQRQKILEEYRKKGGIAEMDIKGFWLKVLKSSYTEFMNKRDEEILTHLIDLRSKIYNDPIVKFVLEFTFEPNTFFSNQKLTKAYYLNCLPDTKNPISYDGAEIYKCEGCKIDWKIPEQNKEERKKVSRFSFLKTGSSFFDFFSPPVLPNVDDIHYHEVNAHLQNDFELGFYIKERVIPKAILFYTGEVSDCQSSSSDDDTDECDDDSSDDGDDEKN